MKFKKIAFFMTLSFVATSCGMQMEHMNSVSDNNTTPKEPRLPKAPRKAEFTEKELKDIRLKKWQHFDLGLDSLIGVSADRAYKSLKLKQKREVIVAVIDSGVDIEHEDLKSVIWNNKNEIPNNGIDDDANGYIDDIHGWNFIGGIDGRNINEESLEETRLLKMYMKKIAAGEILAEAEQTIYQEVKKIVQKYQKIFTKLLNKTLKDRDFLYQSKLSLKEILGITKLDSRADIEAINSTLAIIVKLKAELLELWDSYGKGGFVKIADRIEISKYYVNIGYNVEFDMRSEIIGDDPYDFSDTNYGNNNVKGPDSSHGTHVAGIIAAARNNKIGMNGIAGNVKIMVLRVVPNGDERDKDIALAVRYAVDNGAKIINMSFGKKYSPNKSHVDNAFLYAAKMGVLIIHAAGNDAKNINKGIKNFPNSYKLGSGVFKVDTIPSWIEVGASTRFNNIDLVASFSNYGNEAVHLFAPGHKIYSTTPENTYDSYNGTSMACPVVAGVAAALMSEFPTMTAREARAILFKSVENKAELLVRLPDDDAKEPDFRLPIPFKKLSQTDGVINLFKAMVLAIELSGN